jgi:hypothetical protein
MAPTKREFSTYIRPERAPNTLAGATVFPTLEDVEHAATLVREYTEQFGAKFIRVDFYHNGRKMGQ